MNVEMTDEAAADLEAAFDHYESRKPGLGVEMIEEFRRGVDLILQYPDGWKALGDEHRCHRLVRFPFGIIYLVEQERIVVVAFGHLARAPNWWKSR